MATQPHRRVKRQTTVDDLAELEVVYRAEYTNLVRSLTLLAGSRESAADSVQDAFVVAATRAPEAFVVAIDVLNPPVLGDRSVPSVSKAGVNDALTDVLIVGT